MPPINQRMVKMVRVIKAIIVRKPEDLVRLKYKTGIIFGRNIRTVNKRKEVNYVRTKYQNL